MYNLIYLVQEPRKHKFTLYLHFKESFIYYLFIYFVFIYIFIIVTGNKFHIYIYINFSPLPSLGICQRMYSLTFENTQWMKKEIQIAEWVKVPKPKVAHYLAMRILTYFEL